MKTCSKCQENKPLTDFYDQKKNDKSYKTARCKSCTSKNNSDYQKDNPDKVRARHWKREYGLSPIEHNQMLEKQSGVCGICSKMFDALNVDHCHKTGKIRGLLCPKCNKALGLLGDNIDSLHKAISYLSIPNDDAPV